MRMKYLYRNMPFLLCGVLYQQERDNEKSLPRHRL